jgi:hypothetical protein
VSLLGGVVQRRFDEEGEKGTCDSLQRDACADRDVGTGRDESNSNFIGLVQRGNVQQRFIENANRTLDV